MFLGRILRYGIDTRVFYKEDNDLFSSKQLVIMDLIDGTYKKSEKRSTIRLILSIPIYTSGFSSLFYSISILIFYIHASVILGWLPTYANPDPADLTICKYYYGVVSFAFTVWIFFFLGWLVLSLIYILVTRKQIDWRPLFFTVVTHIISIMITLSPIFEWFID